MKCEICRKYRAVAWLNKRQVCSKCFSKHKSNNSSERGLKKSKWQEKLRAMLESRNQD